MAQSCGISVVIPRNTNWCNIVKEVKNTPLPDDSDEPEDPIIDKDDLKAIFVNLLNGQTHVVVNIDSSKYESGYGFTASVDGDYLFNSEGSKSYYAGVSHYGKEVSLSTNFEAKSRLKVGSVITVTRDYPNKAVLGQLTVTQDMLNGENPVIFDGSVKSMSVSKINNVPYVFVDFDKAILHSEDGSSYIAKIIDDKQKGNSIFYCDNGKCKLSTVTEDSTITHVKSDEKDISLGETVVIERISPNPATVAKIVVTSFDPQPQPEPEPTPEPEPEQVHGLKATLFQNSGLTGDSLDVTGDIACLTGVKMKNGFEANDEVSSLSLPKGSLGIRLFTDCQFKGTSSLYKAQSQYDMTRTGIEMNKAASSVQVIKAIGYAETYYKGDWVNIMGDTPLLDGGYEYWEYMPNLGGKMSSVKVAEGYTARVYDKRDYQGSYIDVKSGEMIPDLSNKSFDNKALSIKFFIDKAK